MKNDLKVKDYCVFIISYKRANDVITYKCLRENGYTGRIFIVVADDDEQLELYKEKYPNEILTFSREETSKYFDICDNFEGMIGSVFPRNALNKIACELGIKYYCVMDDDYNRFSYRRCFGDVLKTFRCNNLGIIIYKCLEYLKNTELIDAFSLAQEGDFIGGAGSFSNIGGKRKIMNVYFFRTITPITFIGRLNEDVNTYLYYGAKGKLFFTINDLSVKQALTQQISGGMTELYQYSGTYVKSFYSVLVAPNAVKINTIGNVDTRIHHKIDWNKAVPKLIREDFKK